jgi:hypothetical protein
MIKLKEMTNVGIKSGDVVYHGQTHYSNTFEDFKPVFFTSEKDETDFYSTRGRGTPTLITAKVYFKNTVNMEVLEKVIEELNITDDEADEHGGWTVDDNTLDFLYVPRLLEKLGEMGYDGYMGWDILFNYEIPIIVVWHKNQIKVLKMEKV